MQSDAGAPVFADMMQTIAALASDLVSQHKAVEFSISFGDKSTLLLGALVPIGETAGATVVKTIEAKAASSGYQVNGRVGPEQATAYGMTRLIAFTMREPVEEPAVH